MSGGLLVCDTISFVGGRFAQSDGVSYLTNMVLWVNGSIQLSGGSFYSRTNPGVAVSQTGGLMVLSEGLQAREYLLYGGTLVAPDISVWPGLFLIAGTVRNTGSLALSEYSRLRIAHTQNLGVLPVGGRAALELEDGGAVRFAGANAWPGYGRLTVKHWSGSRTGGGENQVIFGSDASALTPSQLGQIVFENPAGFPAGTYPAKILASGEVVPDLPSIAFTRGSAGLSLSWSGSAMLYWSTNVGGPFVPVTPTATNLYDTFLADRQRFFILKQGASE